MTSELYGDDIVLAATTLGEGLVLGASPTLSSNIRFSDGTPVEQGVAELYRLRAAMKRIAAAGDWAPVVLLRDIARKALTT